MCWNMEVGEGDYYLQCESREAAEEGPPAKQGA